MENTCTFKFGDREYSGNFLGVDEGFVFINIGERHVAYNAKYVSDLTVNGKTFFFFYINDKGEFLTPVNLDEALDRIISAEPSTNRADVIMIEKMKTDIVNQITSVKDEQIKQLFEEIRALKDQIVNIKNENTRLKQELVLYENGDKLAKTTEQKIKEYEDKIISIEARLKNITSIMSDPVVGVPEKEENKKEFIDLMKKVIDVMFIKNNAQSYMQRKKEKNVISEKRTSMGLMQFDKLLNGGLTYGNSILISFENYTGGDLFSAYVLRGGVESKEQVFLVLNGITEENFWKITRRTEVGFTAEEVRQLSARGLLFVYQIKDMNELQDVLDGFINTSSDVPSRMIVYTIDSFININSSIFLSQFNYIKYIFDGKKRNLFLFVTDYPDLQGEIVRLQSICKGSIQFKKQDLDERVSLRLKIQGLTNDAQKWLGYEITEEGSFDIQSPNIRRV
ncbi:MAG: hypothetical protein ACP5T9_03915 [Thermoplasmata archaeon]